MLILILLAIKQLYEFDYEFEEKKLSILQNERLKA